MSDITGARSKNEAIKLQKQLAELLHQRQFYLRKWRSNDQQVLEHLDEQCKTDELLRINGQEALKTLGLLWNANTDMLQHSTPLSDTYKVTKRNVLSKIAQIFDLLRLTRAVFISAKIIMQQLWQQKLDWDEVLPSSLHTTWNIYYNSLAGVNEITIPQNINLVNTSEKIDIIGFGDASEKVYGACLYAISTERNNKICRFAQNQGLHLSKRNPYRDWN